MKILLLASVALGFLATPAFAQDKHMDKQDKHMDKKEMKARSHEGMESRYSMRHDANRNGILDRRERGYRDLNRDGRDDRYQGMRRYGANACPRGLAKKHNGCMPPGQAARLFREGQRVPTRYGYYTPYNNIPMQYRNQYSLDPNYRYIYRNNNIYVVDPRTSLVQRIISAIL